MIKRDELVGGSVGTHGGDDACEFHRPIRRRQVFWAVARAVHRYSNSPEIIWYCFSNGRVETPSSSLRTRSERARPGWDSRFDQRVGVTLAIGDDDDLLAHGLIRLRFDKRENGTPLSDVSKTGSCMKSGLLKTLMTRMFRKLCETAKFDVRKNRQRFDPRKVILYGSFRWPWQADQRTFLGGGLETAPNEMRKVRMQP